MIKIKILIAESEEFSNDAITILRSLGEVSLKDLHRNDMLAELHNAQVLWVRLRNLIDREIIDAAPQLQYIVSPTTGLNHIDINYAYERGVQVLSLQNELEFLRDIRASSEHTVALILSLMRNIPSSFDHVRKGYWLRDPHKGNELYGKIVGLIGFGRIGQLVAKYLNAFECTILTTDPNVTSADGFDYINFVTLEELLRSSDIISFHVNLNDGTERFFGDEQFNMMKTGSLLINTSRGELIDENALLRFLQSGRLAGAALDVLSREDMIMKSENPLISYATKHSNLLITPHIGGCTYESMSKTETFMAKKLARAVNFVEDVR